MTDKGIYTLGGELERNLSKLTDKDIRKMEWEATVKAVGNTGMVTVPRALVGKRVKIILEVVE